MASLWGEEFTITPTQEVAKKVISRVSKPKEVTVTRVTKSNKVSLDQKLQIIYQNVKQILGRYADHTLVIKTKEDFVEYIDKAISNGVIAIDTETNNSLEPITCKLMGPCIYTPGLKNAYIPINHTDMQGNRLEWQLTEEDVAEQFSRLGDTLIIMHNGKFDYQVIKCTTGVELKCYWDTMIGAKILDENERAGLKEQYISKIDSSIEKYSIDHLFEKIPYNVVDPEIFALYAATDSFMTYKLYQYQKQIFEKSENERLYSLFMNVEMPVVEVVAEMELQGVCIDKEYAKRLSDKYHRKADAIDKKIEDELKKYSSKIAEWRLTPEATYTPTNKAGTGLGKSKSEQLKDPVEVTSPSQLAILLYDVLKIKPPSAKSPRGTGEDILLKIDLPLCKYILEKRGIDKLLGTYIDKLPECVCEKDNRLHAHFNQVGAGTGRLSSSSPNLQNIPSHEYAIRMMFTPGFRDEFVEGDNEFKVYKDDEVLTDDGYLIASELSVGLSLILINEKNKEAVKISNIIHQNDYIILSC